MKKESVTVSVEKTDTAIRLLQRVYSPNQPSGDLNVPLEFYRKCRRERRDGGSEYMYLGLN